MDNPDMDTNIDIFFGYEYKNGTIVFDEYVIPVNSVIRISTKSMKISSYL